MTKGSLRIYLGAAPGVGKTYAMLNEACRRTERGADVVIGVVETHGRVQTAAQLRDLEIVPRRRIEYRGTVLDEMDVDAILARRPDIALIDEFAHTNAPGSRHEKRWQDVQALLDAGIDVISTLNVQHLESLNDVITRITGTVQREAVPDAIVRSADQIELVDMTPEAIRRRLAHGNIYPAERVDAAMSNYFRPGNLGALRELALLWVADRVEEALAEYLKAHGITEAWETRERVVVGISGAPGGDAPIRRAARIARRVGGDLIAVHVTAEDGLRQDVSSGLSDQCRLVEELGGTVHRVVGHSRAETLAAFARTQKATQLVLGASLQSRWYEMWHGSFVGRVARLAGSIDLHVIAQGRPEAQDLGLRPGRTPIDRRRSITAWLLAGLGLPLLSFVATRMREHLDLSTNLLLFLSLVLAIAAIGGRLVAAISAVAASMLVNWYLVPPFHTFTIAEPENIVALVVFLATALTVGTLVDTAARRALEARRARAEAEALARAAASLAVDPAPLSALADQLLVAFALDGVRIRRNGSGSWTTLAESGNLSESPTLVLALPVAAAEHDDDRYQLELSGDTLSADDQRVLRALTDQLAVAIATQRLAHEAAEVEALVEVDAVRTAMLRAVSHDLRTPLASIKALVSGLRDPTVIWRAADSAEALVTIDEEVDRLNRVIGNLLDASRLQIGALAVDVRDVALSETIHGALQGLTLSPGQVVVEICDDIPLVRCDPALLERSLANVVANAVRHSPGGSAVRIRAESAADGVQVLVVDRGPGIPVRDRAKVMAPFQRLGDQDNSTGVGLGLAIAQGFVHAMGGTLTLEDTPGGGLTVAIALQASECPAQDGDEP